MPSRADRGEVGPERATKRGQLVARRPLAPTPFAYRVPKAAEMLGVSKATVWRMVADGTIEARKIGSATVIPHAALEAYFAAAPVRKAAQ